MDDLEVDRDDSKTSFQNETLRHIVNFASNLENNIYGKNIPSSINQEQPTNSNGTIILITTTAGGEDINSQSIQLTRESPGGTIPQPTELDMNQVIKSSPLLEGFQNMLLARGVNLTLIPFMPLSRNIVRKCIVNDIKNRFPEQSDFTPSRKIIDNLLQELKYFSDDFPVFSMSGCKKITSKLDVILEDTHNPIMGGLISDGL